MISQARPHKPCRRDVRRRGQVLPMTLMAIGILSGVVFYAYNVGYQVNRRQEIQSAADSTAITGGVNMARYMNAIAQNNVGMAKDISLVPVLDAQPLSSKRRSAKSTPSATRKSQSPPI